MTFARSLCVTLVLFLFGGIPEALAAAKAPKVKITRQPAAVVAELGQTVTFGVTYTSTTPVTFQWRLNKQPLEGETGATLVIDQALPSTAGSYDVVLTNGGGATASKAAALTVNLAPASLAVDDILDGSFTLKVAGETVDSDGAFIVTGATTLQDPESPSDTYTFTYKRLPKNKATVVINGRFYDSEVGGYITSVETHSLTFTGLANDGRLVASDSLKGYMLPPIGYQQKKLNFTGKGTITLETANSADFASSSVSGGTLTLGGSGSTMINSGGNSGGLTGGTLYIGGSSAAATNSIPQILAPGEVGPGEQGLNNGTITINGATIDLSSVTLRNGMNLYSGGSILGDPVTPQMNGTFTMNGTTLYLSAVTISSGTNVYSGVSSIGDPVTLQITFTPSVTDLTLINETFTGVISLGNSLPSDYGFSLISSSGMWYTFENGLLTSSTQPVVP